MKAILYNQYGSEEVLYEADIAIPTIDASQVLVEVYSTSLNHFDLAERSGAFAKDTDVFPRISGGKDFAGVVKEVGKDVTKFKAGDHVAGITFGGTYAEYIAVNENFLAHVPEGTDLSTLGGVPVAGLTAWTAVVRKANISAGQKVLIVGGSGGVGHVAVQLAKSLGAYVITTAGQKNIDFTKKLGADEVIDYNTPNYWETIQEVDAVIDAIGVNQNETMSVLKEGGIFITMVRPPDQEVAAQYKITASYMQGEMTSENLQNVMNAYINNEFVLHVHQTSSFDLEEIKKAQAAFASKQNVGKWLIKFK